MRGSRRLRCVCGGSLTCGSLGGGKQQRSKTRNPTKSRHVPVDRKMEHISKEDLKIYNYLNVARKNAKLNLVASSLSGLSSLTAYSVSAKSSGQRYVEERKKRKLPERRNRLH